VEKENKGRGRASDKGERTRICRIGGGDSLSLTIREKRRGGAVPTAEKRLMEKKASREATKKRGGRRIGGMPKALRVFPYSFAPAKKEKRECANRESKKKGVPNRKLEQGKGPA